jgi:hypothetical protein
MCYISLSIVAEKKRRKHSEIFILFFLLLQKTKIERKVSTVQPERRKPE